MDKPESGILLVLVIITGEKNRETQSNAGAGAVRRAAADTGRRQTPAGATHTGRQNACGYGGPLRATDVEEQEKEGHCGPRTRRKERGKEGHTSTHPRQTHPEKECLDTDDADGMREEERERKRKERIEERRERKER